MRKVKLRLKLLWYVTKGRASAPPVNRKFVVEVRLQGPKVCGLPCKMMSSVVQASLHAHGGYTTIIDHMDMAEQV